MSIPGKKQVFRLFGRAGFPLADIMVLEQEVLRNGPPKPGEKIMCRHPLDPTKVGDIYVYRYIHICLYIYVNMYTHVCVQL